MAAGEKKYKVSTVVLTTNNKDTIRQCLESAVWSDEIVVIDAFSSDGTIEIAREYTDKIWQRQWPGFAKQWNFGIEKASHDWIFILASDEAIDNGLKEEIIRTVNSEGKACGYHVPRKTFFLNKWIRHCGWYPDYSIRLLKKGSGRFDDKLIHEAISIEGNTGYLKNAISHYSYPGIAGYLERMNRYTSLEASQMRKGADINRDKIKDKAMRRALRTFWRMYIRKQGFRDGMHGLLLSVFSSFYQLLTYAKYWELSKGD